MGDGSAGEGPTAAARVGAAAMIEGLGARFGPYFELTLLRAAAAEAAPSGGGAAADLPAGWARMAELVERPTVLAGRVGAVRAALGAARGMPADGVEERVAASVAQLGLCARVVAPALALAVTAGAAPVMDLTALYWRDVLGGPFPLAVRGPVRSAGEVAATSGSASDSASGNASGGGAESGPAGTPERLARQLADGVLRPVIEPIVAATAAGHSVSTWLLWGNVASGLAGAAGMIGRAEPDLAEPAWRLIDALCADGGMLRGAGARTARSAFRRRSCCLIYRVGSDTASTAALCGDCVLARH